MLKWIVVEEENSFVETLENTSEVPWLEKSCFAGKIFSSSRHPIRIP